MVQQAVAQILTPIFERVFSNNSFGFRPHRGAHDAIAKVVDLYNQGYWRVVDLDLKAYFDNVNHDLMIKYLKLESTQNDQSSCQLWLFFAKISFKPPFEEYFEHYAVSKPGID